MDLLLEEKDILLELGYLETNFPQIEAAMRQGMITYSLQPLELGPRQETVEVGACRQISREQAIALLGKHRYLAGLGRSAFHWSAVQYTANCEAAVYFDSRKFFGK